MINEIKKFKTKPIVKITLHSGNSYVRTLIELTPIDAIIIGTDRAKYNISKQLIESICRV
jgi:hypothetical protein